MSDRRRYPPKDDWDDDLDLVGFDRPASKSSAPQPSSNQPSSSKEYEDDYPGSTVPPARGSSSAQRPSGSSYQSSPSGYADPYSAPSQKQARGSRAYPYDPYGSDESLAEDSYGAYPTNTGAGSPSSPSARGNYGQGTQTEELYSASAYDPGYAEGEYPEALPQTRKARTRQQRSRPSVSVPKPAISDGAVIAIVAASLLSIVFMIASIAAGGSDLPDWFPIHLDAAGNPDLWGNDSTLWRIPFGAFMSLIMALVVAAILWKRDRFAARLAITGTAAIQVIAWVALIDFIW